MTIIYVDLATVQNSTTEWGMTILNKLELAPREKLTVVTIDPNTFDSVTIFDACYPVFTPSEIDDTRKARGIWERLTSSDPLDQQRENLQAFDARLRNALDKIIAASKKYHDGERRNVLGAIAVDKNRYLDQNSYYRVIIYTDGTIKEPGPERASNEVAPTPNKLFERYPVSFSGAEVAVFGISGNAKDGTLQNEEVNFAAFFLKGWAHLLSFSPSLPQQQHRLYPPPTKMDGSYEGGGTQGTSKLSLFVASQGGGGEGWVAFNVGREQLYVPFEGQYTCTADECRLTADCTTSVPPEAAAPYFRKGDRIVLSGKNGRALEGSLRADSREVFKEGNQSVSYQLKFSSQ
jgi:hypothetical protein